MSFVSNLTSMFTLRINNNSQINIKQTDKNLVNMSLQHNISFNKHNSAATFATHK